jgi:hypothetical protein
MHALIVFDHPDLTAERRGCVGGHPCERELLVGLRRDGAVLDAVVRRERQRTGRDSPLKLISCSSPPEMTSYRPVPLGSGSPKEPPVTLCFRPNSTPKPRFRGRVVLRMLLAFSCLHQGKRHPNAT